MSDCPVCGAQMKPLLFSEFCPNDCDRAPTYLPPEITEKIVISSIESSRWTESQGDGLDEWAKAVDEWWDTMDDSSSD